MIKFFLFPFCFLLFLGKCTHEKTSAQRQKINNSKIIRDTIRKGDMKKYVSFPKKLYENSGLETQDGKLFWTFNDSGGKNHLYKVNSNGEIIKELEVKEAKNIDWESIAEDMNFIYIGDFGNNKGNRKDLVIYKIHKEKINEQKIQKIEAQKIMFDYQGRNDYPKSDYQHDFDCEAMFIYKNQIHLLTKAWKTGIAGHYVLPTIPGQYTAKLLEKIPTDGLLTGADVDENHVFAVQYTREGEVTLWRFMINKKGLLFEKQVHATYLGKTKKIGQIEGITVYNKHLYISGEGYEGVSPTLYLIPNFFEKNN